LSLPDETDPQVQKTFRDAYLQGEPFTDNPVLPDDLETLSEAWLNRWAEWVAAGRPDIPESEQLSEARLDFVPAKHPRNPKTGKFVERGFNVPDAAPDFGELSTKDTLAYLDSQGENIDAVLQPGSGVTVDGVPNNAEKIDDIPDDPDSANPGIADDAIDYTLGEKVEEQYLGASFSDPNSDVDAFVDDLEYGDIVSVNGDAVRVQGTLNNQTEFLYSDGDEAKEASTYTDDVRAVDTSISGADVTDNLLGLPVPESDRDTRLPDAAFEQLRQGDIIAIDGTRASVLTSDRESLEVDFGDGVEEVNPDNKTIESVDTRYDFDEVTPDNLPSETNRDIGNVPDDYGDIAQEAQRILESSRSERQTVRQIEELASDATDVGMDFSDFTPAQAAEAAAGISAVLEREGSLPETLDKVQSGLRPADKQKRNSPLAVTTRVGGEDDVINISVSKFTEDNVSSLNEKGWLTGDQPRDVMVHELGHALHHTREKEGSGNGMTNPAPIDSVTENEIEEVMSDYAAHSFPEFVAEGYVERLTQGGIEETEMNLPELLDYALGEDQ
jgi:hypothetical protein